MAKHKKKSLKKHQRKKMKKKLNHQSESIDQIKDRLNHELIDEVKENE